MTKLEKIQLKIDEIEDRIKDRTYRGLTIWLDDYIQLEKLSKKKSELENPISKQKKMPSEEWIEANRLKSKSWRDKNVAYSKWQMMKARNRFGEIIDKDVFIDWWNSTPDVCDYCGLTIDQYLRIRDKCKLIENKNTAMKQLFIANNLSIDRINSDIGYVEGNLTKACMICNCSKGSNIDYEDYKLIAKSVMKKTILKIKESA